MTDDFREEKKRTKNKSVVSRPVRPANTQMDLGYRFHGDVIGILLY